MRKNYSYLKDNTFLKKVAQERFKIHFLKLTVLTWDEIPIEDIVGRCTSANISIDGKSSLRRTCNVSLVADKLTNQLTNVNNLISINKKVKVQVGIQNTTDQYLEYKTLWFPLGLYVISDASISHSPQYCSISLQLRDKMSLLNGDCGGTLPASVQFDSYQTIDQNGNLIIGRPTIVQIIRQLVNHFGGEQLGKILISDINTRVKQVMKWIGSSPLYIVQKQGQIQTTTDSEQYQSFLTQGFRDHMRSPYSYGQDVGFIYTDMTYPGELVSGPGDSVVSVLEKIKNLLGNYQFFYDLQGNFRFQQVKNYLNTTKSYQILQRLRDGLQIEDSSYLLNLSDGKSVFDFQGSTLVSSYNNAPSYSQVKNDFVVWGKRQSISGQGEGVPIRYHLAIDKKPQLRTQPVKLFKYQDPNQGIQRYHVPFQYQTRANFPEKGAAAVYYMARDTGDIYTWTQTSPGVSGYKVISNDSQTVWVLPSDWRTELYLQGATAAPTGTASNYYFTQLMYEWPKVYDIAAVATSQTVNGKTVYTGKLRDKFIEDPMSMNFYLDIIDTQTRAGQLSIENIGRRTAVHQDQDINCVFQPQIPDLVYIRNTDGGTPGTDMSKQREQCQKRGQRWTQVSGDIYSMLSPGGFYNSAYNWIRQMLHEYTSYNESISISAVPLYHLQPNTRITVNDHQSNIYGDYIINSISINIGKNHNTMNINASRAIEKQ